MKTGGDVFGDKHDPLSLGVNLSIVQTPKRLPLNDLAFAANPAKDWLWRIGGTPPRVLKVVWRGKSQRFYFCGSGPPESRIPGAHYLSAELRIVFPEFPTAKKGPRSKKYYETLCRRNYNKRPSPCTS